MKEGMSSMTTQVKPNYDGSPYELFCMAKGLYTSRYRGIGLELLENFKFTHDQVDMEVFTSFVLYDAFNEMTKESLHRRVQYEDVTAPAYSRTMIVDMVSLGYPVARIIRDVDRQHASHLPIPFRERAIIQEVNKSSRFDESAINLLIADYAKSN